MPQHLPRYFLFSIILASWCANASAFFTGNQLAEICGVTDGPSRNEALCVGYVSGVIDVDDITRTRAARRLPPTPQELELIDLNTKLLRKQLENLDQLQPFQLRLIGKSLIEDGLVPLDSISNHCLPGNVTRRQLMDVVTKYLRDNPAQRHLPAPGLVVSALEAAFPCK